MNINFKKENKESISSEKQKGIILPLYFGWGLKIALVRLSKDALNFTSRIFGKKWMEATALVLILIVVGSGIFFYYYTKPMWAATYYFSQDTWAGGADVTATAIHPTGQTGWDKYYSKDDVISAGTEISMIATATDQKVQNTTVVFEGGAFEGASTSDNTVSLVKSLGYECLVSAECVSGFCADGVCCDEACAEEDHMCNSSYALGDCSEKLTWGTSTHLVLECTDLGGTTTDTGVTGTICKRTGTNVSCWDGWAQADLWHSYSSATWGGDSCGRNLSTGPTEFTNGGVTIYSIGTGHCGMNLTCGNCGGWAYYCPSHHAMHQYTVVTTASTSPSSGRNAIGCR